MTCLSLAGLGGKHGKQEDFSDVAHRTAEISSSREELAPYFSDRFLIASSLGSAVLAFPLLVEPFLCWLFLQVIGAWRLVVFIHYTLFDVLTVAIVFVIQNGSE